MKKFFLLLIIFFCLLPTSIFAEDPPAKPTDYTLLAPIPLNGPGSGVTKQTNTAAFIPGLFRLAIGLATALAVIMIIFGGIKYIATAATDGKSDAKSTIENAIWGLLLALSAWLILYTLNPKLVQFDLSIPPQEIRGSTTPPTIGPPGGNCANCVTIGVKHKTAAQNGCKPIKPNDPCQIDAELNRRLMNFENILKSANATPLYVTESYPPTQQHQSGCHLAGECVDVARGLDLEVYRFMRASFDANLRAVYEVESEKRKNEVIAASCASPNPVVLDCKKTLGNCIAVLPPKPDPITGILKPQIKGEHYSVYKLPPCT